MVDWTPGGTMEIFSRGETGSGAASVGVGVAAAVAVGVGVTPGADVGVGVASSPQARMNKVRTTAMDRNR